MLKSLLRPLAVRYRRFMQAEIMQELAVIREERETLNKAMARLEEFDATVKAVEAGLLTMALLKQE